MLIFSDFNMRYAQNTYFDAFVTYFYEHTLAHTQHNLYMHNTNAHYCEGRNLS